MRHLRHGLPAGGTASNVLVSGPGDTYSSTAQGFSAGDLGCLPECRTHLGRFETEPRVAESDLILRENSHRL